MKYSRFLPRRWAPAAAIAWLAASSVALAQWQSQEFQLKPGWNGVFLHVDASHVSLNTLLSGVPIDEVWMWKPELSTLQFVTSPLEPSPASSRWLKWQRSAPLENTLDSLVGNAAYLVKVQDPLPDAASELAWTVQGKPVPPSYLWSSQGINFLGFPTVPTGAPDFESFLTPAPNLLGNAEIYEYKGGLLTDNPTRVFAYRTTEVTRGKAFWIREPSTYNRYYGPFELVLQNKAGVDFGPLSSVYSLRIRNLTPAALTVTLTGVSSEAPPAGQPDIAGDPPVLIRGALNPADLTYAFTRLADGPQNWTLQPAGQLDSEVEVVLGLDRAGMTGSPGDLFASILRFTDGSGFTQVDVPVSATQLALAGLWIGEARITGVRHNLAFYDRTGDEPVLTNTVTTVGGVLRPFPLRLIVFVPAAGQPLLLQRVYSGLTASGDPILTTSESLLDPDRLDQARRLSAVHLPWSGGNLPWTLAGGGFAVGSTLTTTVTTAYDDQAASPFLHTYHPDHDNRNATFTAALNRGEESYEIVRAISLALASPADTFLDLTRSGDAVSGTYAETITLNGRDAESRQYQVEGTFTLTRKNFLDTLTLP